MGAIETRNVAYFEHRNSGKLGSQQQALMLFFHQIGHEGMDFSLREIEAQTGIDINAVSARCNELKNMPRPFLVESAKRPCNVTGRKVTPLRLA